MTRHLCISVTLLDPLFHGQADDRPEWPPSPLRLFQALLAGARVGAHNRLWSTAKAEAFRWLEQRDPPVILAPDARPAAAYTLFVPNNDGDRKSDRQDRLTPKLVRPSRLTMAGDSSTLHYVWPIPPQEWPAARAHADLLCAEARHLLALGWGIDQAVGNGRVLAGEDAARLPGRCLQPWPAPGPGAGTWRVPAAGSLADLERVHHSFLHRIDGRRYAPPARLGCFDTVTYLPAAVLPPRPYAAFELPDGVAFRQERANEVAAMLRSLACRCARADAHRFPGGPEVYVAGHVADEHGPTPPRFSYLPLPTIGHPHADGLVRRLLVAEPHGGDGSHARWAGQRLRSLPLLDEEGNERGVLLDPWRAGSRPMLARYVGAAESWCTVTPVVLPGFDGGKRAKAEKLLLQALDQAGVPPAAVSDLALRKAPFWPGSQHPCHYRKPAYLAHLPAWHVWLGLRESLPGPLAIGAGRHCGLGVFAAAASDDHR